MRGGNTTFGSTTAVFVSCIKTLRVKINNNDRIVRLYVTSYSIIKTINNFKTIS